MFARRVLWSCAAMLLSAASFGASSSDVADAAMKGPSKAIRSDLRCQAKIAGPSSRFSRPFSGVACG